jgi:hypothetical protein
MNHEGKQFHSGKFGNFIKTIQQSQEKAYDKTYVIDGKVYYTSESIAKEAAAARAVDCFAFTLKHRDISSIAIDDTLQPLRYCVEMPVLQGIMSLGMSSSYPQYDWLCQMQRKYGPIDVSYDIRTEQFESPSGKDQNWFSASCVEPLTGEAFDSGVFTGRKGYSFYPPNALKIPLILEEINIRDGRVYYNNEEAAKSSP